MTTMTNLETQSMARTGALALMAVPRKELSNGFIDRLYRFATWDQDWDGEGAEKISPKVLARAVQIARTSLFFADEPFVAPAGDGTVLLKWNTRKGTIEFYVEREAGPSVVVTEFDDVIREVPIGDEAQLFSMLVAAS